jgi:hypothetical protein
VVLDVTGAETRMTFPLSYFPSDLVVDPDQAVLAQVQVQPIAELPEVCPKTP